MQNVLIKLTKNIHNLKNPNSFKIWLNQIIVNTYYDYLRKNKKLEGKIYSDGMKQLQQTLDAAKQQLFEGEGTLTTRIKDYLGAVDKK